MNKENYRLLQVDENASDEEIKACYERLKEIYNEEKWKDGEEGNNAARMLEKLDVAYQEIMEERREQASNTSGTSSFEEVGDCIRRGDIARAQQLLDDFNERSAEWHYLQSVVFYKKNWMQESKKQLEIAIQMDGSNEKYKTAYAKLKEKIEFDKKQAETPRSQTYSGQNQDTIPGDDQQMGGGGGFCEQCATCCACNVLFNLCLNACCGCR